MVICEDCNLTFPMKGMFLRSGRSVCESCANIHRSGDEAISEGELVTQIDPTVCLRCNADSGDIDCDRIMNVPVCAVCERFLRNRPFPSWLKIAFVGFLGVAIFSFVHHQRFIFAYRERMVANKAFAKGDFETAMQFIDSASRRVPESLGMRMNSLYIHALDFLSQDKPTEALPLLKEIKYNQPSSPNLDKLILHTEAGASFDAKDYDQFLEKSTAYLQINSRDPQALAGVASAHACKYAITGDENHRHEALTCLEKAKQIAGADDARLKEYETRIQYRLQSREIISSKEYYRRFSQSRPQEQAK